VALCIKCCAWAYVTLNDFVAVVHSVIIRPKRSIASGESWKYSTDHVAKNGDHAFGYKSAESEPIWMKSGAL